LTQLIAIFITIDWVTNLKDARLMNFLLQQHVMVFEKQQA